MGAAKITSTGIAWNTSITAVSGTHGGISNNFVDSSGNFYFVIPQATPAALKVYKLSSTGSITWQKVLTGTNAGSGALAVDGSGNVVVAAQSWNGTNYDGCLIKLDSSGSLVWQVKLASSNSYDYFEDLAIDSSGNIYTCGFMFINDTSNVIAKYNSSGALQWQRKLTGSGGGTPPLYGIVVESGGSNIYVTGTVSDSGPTGRWTIAKYNSSGTIQWQRTLSSDTGSSSGNGAAVDSSNNVYVTGSGTVSSVTLQRLAKYNSSGTIQWQRRLILKNGSLSAGVEYGTVDSFNNIYIGVNTSGLSSSGGNENGIIKVPANSSASYSTALLKMGMQYTSSSITEGVGAVTSTASTDTLTSLTKTAGNSSSAIYAVNNSLSKAVL
jgi:hypothetical protein